MFDDKNTAKVNTRAILPPTAYGGLNLSTSALDKKTLTGAVLPPPLELEQLTMPSQKGLNLSEHKETCTIQAPTVNSISSQFDLIKSGEPVVILNVKEAYHLFDTHAIVQLEKFLNQCDVEIDIRIEELRIDRKGEAWDELAKQLESYLAPEYSSKLISFFNILFQEMERDHVILSKNCTILVTSFDTGSCPPSPPAKELTWEYVNTYYTKVSHLDPCKETPPEGCRAYSLLVGLSGGNSTEYILPEGCQDYRAALKSSEKLSSSAYGDHSAFVESARFVGDQFSPTKPWEVLIMDAGVNNDELSLTDYQGKPIFHRSPNYNSNNRVLVIIENLFIPVQKS